MIEFIPNAPFAEALAQASKDVDSWNAIRPTGVNRETQWAGWAGDELKAMMQSPDRLITNVESLNAEVRLAAVALMVDYWPPRELFAELYLKTAFEDPVSAIRGAALTGLVSMTPYINDRTGWLERLLKALYAKLSEEEVVKGRRFIDENRAAVRQFETETMRKLAGDQLEAMLESRPAAESFLQSTDPKMRRAALFVVSHNWKPTKQFAELCEHLIIHDTNTEVRVEALAQLASIYHQTDDKRIGGMLARLVYDDKHPIELRTHAYRMLFHVRGMPLEGKKEKAWSMEFRFPDEVDWAFVDGFLQYNGPSEGSDSAEAI